MIPYAVLYALAVVSAVSSAMLVIAQLVGPAALGLPPQASAWMGVLGAGLGALAGFLPRVTSTPGSPPNAH